MKEEILAVESLHEAYFQFISMGLHTRPQKLHDELAGILDSSAGFERIILGFGLCGGAARGLKAKECVLTVPRVHDCIPVFLGSRKVFDELQKTTGTFYMTCGWLECGSSILSEYQRVCAKYGENKARTIYNRIYDSYRQVLFIETGHPRSADGLSKSGEVARLLGLRHRTDSGRPEYLRKLVNGPWDGDEFINISPGKAVDESFFLGDMPQPWFGIKY